MGRHHAPTAPAHERVMQALRTASVQLTRQPQPATGLLQHTWNTEHKPRPVNRADWPDDSGISRMGRIMQQVTEQAQTDLGNLGRRLLRQPPAQRTAWMDAPTEPAPAKRRWWRQIQPGHLYVLALVAAVVGLVLGALAIESSDDAKPATYTSAGQLVHAIEQAGFQVGPLVPDTGQDFVTATGAQEWDATIDGQGAARGASGLFLFPNHRALADWQATSESFGGVAVVGDTWAISLPAVVDPLARQASLRVAPILAAAMGGQVSR